MKTETMIGLGLGVIGLAALLYYFFTKQQPATTIAPATTPSPGFVPSYDGAPTTDATSQLLALASQQCGISGSSVSVRSLRPEDLGLTTSFSFTSTVANTWENWVNTTIADCRFIAITGVSYGGSNFTQLRVQAGASYRGYAPLEFITGLESQLYFFAQPIIVEQNTPCIIDVISSGAATEDINLMGIVVEKAGMLIA